MKTLFLLTIALLINTSFAQWSTDPNTNLKICDVAGEQALAKIAMTSDGGCYISWFDTRSGSYNVYLQRLDALGYKQWAADGLLISNNPQDTWITDYDLICDQNDNAVIVFSDIRSGGLLKPFAYMISPTGNFLWGANGVDISTGDNFQPSPVVTETSDGNFVFAWISSDGSQKIALQKLSATGQKLWGATPILIQSGTEDYSYPAVVKSDNDQVILVHTVQTGGFPPQVRIRAHKLDLNGQLVWGSTGVMIQDNGQMAFFQVPEVESDGNNGALIAWYDGRAMNNLSSSFIQHISSAGNLYFPANGAEGSLAAERNKFSPQVAYNSATQETYLFWIETEPNQNQNGICGQKFSPSGNRIWGNTGMVFVPLSAPNTKSISDLSSHMGNNQIYIFYLDSQASGLNSMTMGFACDTTGGFIWSGNFVTLSNATQEKLQMETAMDVYKNCKLVWGDKRFDASGIYAQDINPSGQLGQPVIPVELTTFEAVVNNNEVILNWTTSTETNNRGFEIERLISENSLAQNWERIGYVEGNGTTTEPKNYNFIDKETPEGKVQYRLKQIDFDGSFNHSNTIEVEINYPDDYILFQNYPNPFNPVTVISFQIPTKSYVSLKIYDLLGNEITTLVDEEKNSGVYSVNFDAPKYASGIYFYEFKAGDFRETKTMLMLK
ncbi:MAG: T9SS type A sorting domain-containing protein [Ignavibacteriaceae bacterium]|nr:T9SS type A sorting domain-containing protein [Ignavibacteriaceae bacterium]